MFKIKTGIVCQDIKDGMIIMNMKNEKVICFENFEKMIFNYVLNSSIAETITYAQNHFEGSKEQIKTDITNFVSQLIENDILEEV